MADETINISQDQLDNYKVNVVCTDLALSSLPLHLPPDTIYLNMADNKVIIYGGQEIYFSQF